MTYSHTTADCAGTAEGWTTLRPPPDPAQVVDVLRRAAQTLRESAKTAPGSLVSAALVEPLACLLDAEANTVCRHSANVAGKILAAVAAEPETVPVEAAKAAAWAGDSE